MPTKDDAPLVLPPTDLEGMRDLSRFLDLVSEPAVLVGPDGAQVGLPLEVYRALGEVVDAMREGKAISLFPLDQVLTTQQAADLLGISRPTLVRLLRDGEIPHTQPGAGRHRRVRLTDVLAYRDRTGAARRQALDELTTDAADAGLYELDAALPVDAVTRDVSKH